MSTPYGVSVRESRPASHSLCRVRGGNVVRGQLVMLDLAGTESVATARPGDAGTKTVQGSPWATVVPATAGLVAGRVGVVMATTSDDLLAPVELGDGGAGGVRDVIVEALVLVSASAVEGASLGVTTSSGVTVLDAGVAGGAFATLLDAATSGSGAVMRRVVLHAQGRAITAKILAKDVFVPVLTGGLLTTGGIAMCVSGSASAVVAAAVTALRCDLLPFVPSHDVTFAQLGIYVSAGVAGTAKILVYESDADLAPDALLWASGDLDTSSAAFVSASSGLPTFTAGTLYWIGVLPTANPTLRCIAVGEVTRLGLNTTTGSSTLGAIRRSSLTYASPPDPWGYALSQLVGGTNSPLVLGIV